MDYVCVIERTSPEGFVADVQQYISEAIASKPPITEIGSKGSFLSSYLIATHSSYRILSYLPEEWEEIEGSNESSPNLSIRSLEGASQTEVEISPPQRQRALSLFAAAEAFYREAVFFFYSTNTFVFEALALETCEPDERDDIRGVKSFFSSLGPAALQVRKVEIQIGVDLLTSWRYKEMIHYLSQLQITHLSLWVIMLDENRETPMTARRRSHHLSPISKAIQQLIGSAAYFRTLQFFEIGRIEVYSGTRLHRYHSPVPNPCLMADMEAYCTVFMRHSA